MNFVCIVFELGDKMFTLSSMVNVIVQCKLQEVAASWLQSHAANVHGASSVNCFPFSPTAPSDQKQGVLIMCEECDATCSRALGYESGFIEQSPA